MHHIAHTNVTYKLIGKRCALNIYFLIILVDHTTMLCNIYNKGYRVFFLYEYKGLGLEFC